MAEKMARRFQNLNIRTGATEFSSADGKSRTSLGDALFSPQKTPTTLFAQIPWPGESPLSPMSPCMSNTIVVDDKSRSFRATGSSKHLIAPGSATLGVLAPSYLQQQTDHGVTADTADEAVHNVALAIDRSILLFNERLEECRKVVAGDSSRFESSAAVGAMKNVQLNLSTVLYLVRKQTWTLQPHSKKPIKPRTPGLAEEGLAQIRLTISNLTVTSTALSGLIAELKKSGIEYESKIDYDNLEQIPSCLDDTLQCMDDLLVALKIGKLNTAISVVTMALRWKRRAAAYAATGQSAPPTARLSTTTIPSTSTQVNREPTPVASSFAL
eukprot:GILK01001998.1.p1 GENE.GILK01001998.1~~GILK01001998.1.p1  ORF type:complete len:341 (-),score=76.54 GILK01001998.1:54-1034(-)